MTIVEQSADAQNSDSSQPTAGNAEPSNDLQQQLIDDLNSDEQNAGDSQEQTQAEEQDEIEVDGEKFSLPKTAAEKLKAERMMHADYTRKTQAHAEQVRAENERHQKRTADFEQDFADRARLHGINDTLKQYGQVDWRQAWETDPVAAGQAQAQYQALMHEQRSLEGSIAQKQQNRALEEQQEIAKLTQDAEAYVAREIPGWTQQRGEELKHFAESQGITMNMQVARTIIENPAFLKIMHKAALFDQLEKGQVKQPPKLVQNQPQVKPVPRVGASTARVDKDPTQMSDAEFAAYRRKVSSNRR